MLLKVLILLLVLSTTSLAQITKPGVEGSNGGTLLGRALTVNCDNVCIICSLSSTILTISFNPSCSSGPPPQFYLAYRGVTMTYLGVNMTYLGR